MSDTTKYDESVKRINERAESHRKTDIRVKEERIEIKDADFFGSQVRGAKDKPVKFDPNETVVSYRSPEAQPYIGEIQHVNLILTNACNLNCPYCYEQHREDFGTWSSEKIHNVYKWFNENTRVGPRRRLQFFGGEPLIHRKLILEYLRDHKEELTLNRDNMKISIVSNGTLLSPEFIEEYFSYNFTGFLLSIDTFNMELDQRGLSDKQMQRIFNSIDHIVKKGRENNNRHPLSVRCTISLETAPDFRAFAQQLTDLGVRDMIVHPLTMSNYHGYIDWPEDVWNQLQADLMWAINHLGMDIEFSEGVAKKGSTGNCLTGNSMIAIDGSGDFSGCYFFTNLKKLAHPFVLGNLFEDRMYLDRYESFHEMYKTAFDGVEKCKTCDLKGYCYQCPAGNADTGDGKVFRPDTMCQKIVQMYLDIRAGSNKALFARKFNDVHDTLYETKTDEERDAIISRTMCILAYRREHKRWPQLDFVAPVDNITDAARLFLPDGYQTLSEPDLAYVMEYLKPGSVKNLPAQYVEKSIMRDSFLLTLLHFSV